MSTINLVQDKSINYEVFVSGERKLGTAELTLPTVERMTSTISGAGIGGEIEMPTPGMTSSMEAELTWRTLNERNTELLAMKAHDLELRNANEVYDAGTGLIKVQGIKINIRGLLKSGDLGSFKPADHTDTKTTLEVLYLKITIDGKRKVEIDKLNYIDYVDGTDYAEAIRKVLGV